MSTRVFDHEAHKRFVMQALLALAIVTFAGGAAVFYYVASVPYVGFEFSGKSVVGAVAPGGPAAAAGLQIADRILTIDGLAPMSSGEIYLRPGADRLRLEVARGQQTLALMLDPAAPPLESIVDKAGYFLMALGFWLAAALVLVFKPKDSLSQFFVLLTLLGTAAIVMWRMADLGPAWANTAMGVLTAVIGPMFVQFHTIFPERSHFRGKSALLRSLYGVGIALAIVSLGLDMLYYTGLYRHFGTEPWPSAAMAIKAFFGLCVLVGVVLLLRIWRITESEHSRRQIALVVVGTALALLPLIILILVPQILFAQYLVPSWIPLLMLTALPASYLYATYRHDLMKLDGMVNRSVVVCFLGLALVLLYLGLEWGIRSLAPGAPSGSALLGNIIPVLALLFAFQPLKHWIERSVDRVFYGGWYSYESLILEMSQSLNEAADVQTIVTLLTENASRTMRIKEIALLLPDEEDAFCAMASRGFEPAGSTCLPQGLVALLQECGRPVEHRPLSNWLRSESGLGQEIAAFSRAGVQIWVPLVNHGKLEAVLMLGRKMADEFYTEDDQAILFTLAQQAAIALARTRLVDELKGRLDEVRTLSEKLLALQERNQQQMALDLHDQAVQDLRYVQRQVDKAWEKTPSRELEGARDELERIGKYLDTLIFELRPPELEQGNLGQILGKYAANFELRRELPVSFRAKGGSDSAALPEEIKVAVFRIFQESLNNARKHAEASLVEAYLDVQQDRVRLEVHDDGVGFGMSSYLDKWIGANRFGLVGMRTRTEEVGGHLQVTSQPGQGTHVFLEIPLSAQPWHQDQRELVVS